MNEKGSNQTATFFSIWSELRSILVLISDISMSVRRDDLSSWQCGIFI